MRSHRMIGAALGGVAALILCTSVTVDATGSRDFNASPYVTNESAHLAGFDVDSDDAAETQFEEIEVPTLASMPDADPQFAEQVHVIMRDLGLSEEDAIAHVDGTLERLDYREAAYEEIPDCVGGFDYDPYTSTMTVYSLNEQCDAELMARADDMPFGVTMERTEQSIDDLQAVADDLNSHPPADLPELAFASVDDERNAVVLNLEDDSIPAFSEDTEPDPLLAASVTSDSRLNNVKVVVVRTDENVAE
ncbi:hypothetical protein [Actinobaculum sp. 313]|uniref:hypothetical protein n=1 Tax=Actinobaculum sp. 313 TaxID=2495645 RepID=UPI000F73FC4D|nr:hypothetical protein [Actinobaculum sp. 313]RTE48733.1 hypothetical protein EKN07_08440 [Actinobaculum sp. 352]